MMLRSSKLNRMREIQAVVNTNVEISKNIILKSAPFIIKIAKDWINYKFSLWSERKKSKLKLYLSCHKQYTRKSSLKHIFFFL